MGQGKDLTQEVKDRIMYLLKQGVPRPIIAQRLGISRNSVSAWARKNGIRVKPPKDKV